MTSKVIRPYKKEQRSIYNKSLGIIFNGDDNCYPLVHENIIKSSPTAKRASDMYGRFLVGAGFEQEINYNLTGKLWDIQTPDDFLFSMKPSLERHRGVFVHVTYNALFEKTSFKVIPYNLCRRGKKDSENYSGKIVVSPKGWGRSVRKADLKVYDNYNPNPKVLQVQIEAAGGILKYAGQISFLRFDTLGDYPESPIDGVEEECITEDHMGKYSVSSVTRGFKDVDIVRYSKQIDDIDDVIDQYSKVSGVENAGSALFIEDDFSSDLEKDGLYRFDKLEDTGTPKKYEYFDNRSFKMILGAFGIPIQLLEATAGKLGNSGGEDLKVLQSMYNITTGQDRQKIERFVAELFRGFKDDINPSNNWTIKQYSITDDGTAEEEEVVEEEVVVEEEIVEETEQNDA